MNKNEVEKTVFIACSSRDEIDTTYFELTKSVSEFFVKEGYNLAFGGATNGMMGESYKTFRKNDKSVYSYTVEKYRDDLEENLRDTYGYIYPNTFQRTESLYKKADIIVFLPGGTGTLSELFACIEENRTTDEPKQIILLNYHHFFDQVIDLIYYCVTNKFNSTSIYNYFHICNTEEELKRLVTQPQNKELTFK